jgi:hypothetical protein
MADPAADAQQPSPEELQAYLEQMRDADVAEIVAQAFQILAMGAEVKIGQPDARVLIDALAAVVDATNGKVQAELANGMVNAVRQLQSAQVQGEQTAAGDSGEPAQAGAGGATSQSGTGAPHPGRSGAGQGGQQGQSPPQGQPGQPQGGQKMTDRLWTPGQS